MYLCKYICIGDLNIVPEPSCKGGSNGYCVPLILMVPLIFQKMEQATTVTKANLYLVTATFRSSVLKSL